MYRNFFLCFFGVAMAAGCPIASADLMLHPTRIVLDDRQRTAELELINRSDATEEYQLRLVRRRMTDTGEFVPADDPMPGEQFADQLVRISPRSIVMAPRTAQTVRLLVRKPEHLAPGEYRSHLLFEKVPTPRAIDPAEASATDGVAISLIPLVNVSIPVIIRHGETHAAVSITDLALERSTTNECTLSLYFRRSGNRSVYGDLVVYFAPHGGTERIVAKVPGVAVYAPNAFRKARIVLKPSKLNAITAGSLRVAYRDHGSKRGNSTLAEASLSVN